MLIPQGCRLQLPLLDGQGERSGVVTLRLHTTSAISLLLSSHASRHTDTLEALNAPAPPHPQVLSFTGFISTKVQILAPHPPNIPPLQLSGTHFTCFTRTKVQVLTPHPQEISLGAGGDGGSGGGRGGGEGGSRSGRGAKVSRQLELLFVFDIYVSSYCYICVLILLHMYPHTAIYVSSHINCPPPLSDRHRPPLYAYKCEPAVGAAVYGLCTTPQERDACPPPTIYIYIYIGEPAVGAAVCGLCTGGRGRARAAARESCGGERARERESERARERSERETARQRDSETAREREKSASRSAPAYCAHAACFLAIS
jgi:hypothetical protein